MHIWMSAMLQQTTTVVASPPFFTNDLEGALKVGGMILAIVSAFWVMLKGKLQQDINGVGDRVKKLEESVVNKRTRLDTLHEQVRDGAHQAAGMREQIGEMRRAQETLNDQLHDMQVTIIGEIQATRDVVRQEMSSLRERVVRLETLTEIERKTGRKTNKERQHDSDDTQASHR